MNTALITGQDGPYFAEFMPQIGYRVHGIRSRASLFNMVFDSIKPDGAPRKLMDVARLGGLGRRATIGLEQGLTDTYRWYLDHTEQRRS